MMTDGQILALKERCEKHKDVWLRGRFDGARRIASVDLRDSTPGGKSTYPLAVLVLDDGHVVRLQALTATDVVTLKPWDGSTSPNERDNLTMLQDAAVSGLNVNFMTGDISLPSPKKTRSKTAQ